jgi:hypothetical protein
MAVNRPIVEGIDPVKLRSGKYLQIEMVSHYFSLAKNSQLCDFASNASQPCASTVLPRIESRARCQVFASCRGIKC